MNLYKLTQKKPTSNIPHSDGRKQVSADGVTTAGAGTVTTLVREKPTTDIPVVWTIRTEV